jgi:hypothetical protein
MSQKSTPRSLNSPTGNAFRNKNNFQFYMLESGDDFPSARDEQSKFGSGHARGPFFPASAHPGFVTRVTLAGDEVSNA